MSELNEKTPLLEVRNLRKLFPGKSSFMKKDKAWIKAVDGVSFKLDAKETLGVVGESGCGKSTMGRSVLRLIEPTEGEILYKGKDFTKASGQELRKMRADMQIIFQDPYSSLNPRMTVSQSIAAPLIIQGIYQAKEKDKIQKRVDEMMELVGLAKRFANSYPHELDGGRRQRIGIARALSLNPKFIVCDEPVSALDVSIQAQVLNLMQDLQEKLGLTYLFITHNLSVVKHLSNRIMVMYLGQMVELAEPKALFANPMHPYTKALLSAIPTPDPDQKMDCVVLKGELTSPINVPEGCRFAKRCIYARPDCETKKVEMREAEPGHFVACHLCGELGKRG